MSRPAVPPLAASSAIAAAQHGVPSAAQAVSAGFSVDAVRRLVRTGVWARIRPGVYALWIPQARHELWRHRLAAAALWLGGASAGSHRAAATVWGLDGIGTTPIELSTTGRRRATEPGLVVHRVRSLTQDEFVVRDGIPVTSVPRTLIDLCAVLDARSVELALESCLRLRHATVEEIAEALQSAGPRWRSKKVLGPLLDGMPPAATDSALEVIVWRLLLDAGLPPPIRQYEVHGPRGKLVGRVDLAYPAALIAIEADGYGSHSSLSDWQRDRTRQNALIRLGWRVHRVTWEDAKKRPRRVASDIAGLLTGTSHPRVLAHGVRQAHVLGHDSLERAERHLMGRATGD